ncbi:MAG: 16S rRNA (adenine(1518)-N(6)/adenine(1519)-N(6))-dimethyltransferase, partial [Clostridia bacterium]|nr:16S rRNA (adenine(1518)-N(6)/adenine(1519)-N(6))-dimethyltransferase [Clostridia bacterium]
MEHISSPAHIKAIMQANGLTFHKGLGQNFLFDDFFLSKIVDSADITGEDTVLEIGPGLGVLTTRLAEKAKKVIAVEIDQNIVPVLQKLTVAYNNIEIINKDILKTDLKEILPENEKVKVVANLPYYITSPIIMKLLTETSSIST